jgi:hypothetical protein
MCGFQFSRGTTVAQSTLQDQSFEKTTMSHSGVDRSSQNFEMRAVRR